MMQPLRLLIVEDDTANLESLQTNLTLRLKGQVEIIPESDFDRAVKRLHNERFDLVILDVRREDNEQGEEAGRLCFEAIQKARFIPVIFHTGLPESVRDLESPVVQIVGKSGPPADLTSAVTNLIDSGLPRLIRGLTAQTERVQRDYLWGEGSKFWNEHGKQDLETFAHLLTRRLAISFESAGVTELLAHLHDAGGQPETKAETGLDAYINPLRIYIYPPLKGTSPRMGDLFAQNTDGSRQYYLMLTPSCDFVEGGTRHANTKEPILAKCTLFKETTEYREFVDSPSKSKLEKLEKLLSNNRSSQRERYYFLPGFFEVPELVVDLANLTTVTAEKFATFERIASLDAPFAAAIITGFLRYFGRFGTSVLDHSTRLSGFQAMVGSSGGSSSGGVNK